MELFREDGCLSDEGLHALTAGQLDELGRLEAAEHLAYCDKCTDRYTALLTADALADPPRDVRRTVMSTIWVRLMQSTYGRAAGAGGGAPAGGGAADGRTGAAPKASAALRGSRCAAAQRLARPAAFQLFYLPAKRMLLPVSSGDSDLSLFSVIDTLPHKDSFFDKNNSIYYTPCQRRNKH